MIQQYLSYLLRSVGLSDDMLDDHYIKALFSVPYRSDVLHDKNRIYDAKCLRDSFIDANNPRGHVSIVDDLSIFEVWVALALRASESVISGETETIAAHGLIVDMLDNSALAIEDREGFYSDIVESIQNVGVQDDGYGGPFPLAHPLIDQRGQELWYQMMSYLNENYDDMGRKRSSYLQKV